VKFIAFQRYICSNFAIYVIIGYCVWALLLMKILPGKDVKGPITPKGNIPVYKDNGFIHYVVTMITLFMLTIVLKRYELSPSMVYGIA
jgi:7-dehydrocholesterol reductase